MHRSRSIRAVNCANPWRGVLGIIMKDSHAAWLLACGLLLPPKRPRGVKIQYWRVLRFFITVQRSGAWHRPPRPDDRRKPVWSGGACHG